MTSALECIPVFGPVIVLIEAHLSVLLSIFSLNGDVQGYSHSNW